jgi:magnesium-transporting ATPase (P-type)
MVNVNSDETVQSRRKSLAVYEDSSAAQKSWNSESPDEVALVAFADNIGIEFIGEINGVISLNIKCPAPWLGHDFAKSPMPACGLPFNFTVKHKLEFSSSRKRMSVIVACPDGVHRLLCKGADDKIESLCAANASFESARAHLRQFSAAGLRTLALCYREMSADEVAAFAEREQQAIRQLMDKSEIDLLWQSIEHGCVCLGSTAIEDKLQEGVPETILALRQADVKVWMLTGDKRETAHDIAKSTSLIDDKTIKCVFSCSYSAISMIKDVLNVSIIFICLQVRVFPRYGLQQQCWRSLC